jgi:hypothetical protein
MFKNKIELGFKPAKGCITFKPLRKLADGYRIIQTADGAEYDYMGVEVETKEGHNVTIALECLPNGIMNLYCISSLYEIELPKTGFHRTVGKLVRIKKPTTNIIKCEDRL